MAAYRYACITCCAAGGLSLGLNNQLWNKYIAGLSLSVEAYRVGCHAALACCCCGGCWPVGLFCASTLASICASASDQCIQLKVITRTNWAGAISFLCLTCGSTTLYYGEKECG